MSDTTLIQQTATQLYTAIKAGLGDIKLFAAKPSVILFCTILTKASTAVEGFKSNGVSLSSAEKQSVAIAIGRLFVIDVKGATSPDVAEYDSLAVPMIDLLVGFSNELVEVGKKIETKCLSLSCFKKRK